MNTPELTDVESFLCLQWSMNDGFDSTYWWNRTADILHGAQMYSTWVNPEDSDLLSDAVRQAEARAALALTDEREAAHPAQKEIA